MPSVGVSFIKLCYSRVTLFCIIINNFHLFPEKEAYSYQCSCFQWVPKQYKSNILIKLVLLTNDYGQTNIEFYNYHFPQFFFNLVKRQELISSVHYHSYCLDLNLIYIIDLSCTRNYDSLFCKRELLELLPPKPKYNCTPSSKIYWEFWETNVSM